MRTFILAVSVFASLAAPAYAKSHHAAGKITGISHAGDFQALASPQQERRAVPVVTGGNPGANFGHCSSATC